MRQSKLKWVVGGLMLSAGSLIAVAGLSDRREVVACDGPPALPMPMLSSPTLEPPVVVPTPTPSELPQVPAVSSPVPLSIPLVESPTVVESAKPNITVKPLELPKFEAPEPIQPAAAVIPATPAPVATPPIPAVPATPSPAPVKELELPAPPVSPLPEPKPVNPEPTLAPKPVESPMPASAATAGATVIPTLASPQPISPVSEPRPTPSTVVTPAPTPAVQQQTSQPLPSMRRTSQEKKLNVILHLGDDRPRFEVRDGEEVYLKVVCERVDVKSPSDQGENMSTLRASGKVTFITPGGEGTCQELTLAPGTGQVVVAGQVSFKYNWGKVETTVSGESMTFRLGSAPGQASESNMIPAGFTK